MKDYHDSYLKWDVLLLADVFEICKNNSLKNYGLYPSHYLSALALDKKYKLFDVTKFILVLPTF